DMLFLAQTENAAHALHPRDINLAAEVQGLFDYYEAWAEDRGVALRCEGSARSVCADQAMLRRAVGNLLSNAIRHAVRGSVVRVHLESLPAETVIAVENSGPEISPAHLPRLFDRFYRVDPARQRSSEGVGLGLAIVKSIAEAHHGHVRVQSAHGITRFELRLPNNF
ncbi:MAG TPA: ATP-binding protein, partial [Burkholderiaceae bacterium]